MNLRWQALSAGRWTTASAVSRVVIHTIQTVVLARLLNPSDFGLMAAAGSILAVLSVLGDFGVNRIIMYRKDLDADILCSLFWFNLASSVGLTLLFVCAAPILARTLGGPELLPVIVLCAFTFPIAALGAQFRTLAAKEFRFAELARIEVLSAMSGLVAGLLLAFTGAGVYALVGGALISVTCGSALAWIWLSKGRRPGLRIQFRGVRNWLPFSSYVIGESIAGALHREAEVLIASIIAGPASIGVFAVPRALCLRVSNSVVNPVITRVSIPLMARLHDDIEQVRQAYLASLRMTAAINFPIYVFLCLFASEVVAVVYGPRWENAVPFLEMLAVWGLLRSTGNPVGSLLIAGGHARRGFVWNVSLCFVIPPLLWLGASLAQLEGLVAMMVAIQFFVFFVLWRFLVLPLSGISIRKYLTPLSIPLMGSGLSSAFAYAAASALDAHGPRLALGGSVMAGTYLLISFYFNRQWFDTMLELFRGRATRFSSLKRP